MPPLRHDVVRTVKAQFPQLPVILNGGLRQVGSVVEALSWCDGVMLGREAYHRPWLLVELRAALSGGSEKDGVPDRMALMARMADYAARELARGERLVATLNQNEREPLAVQDQVVQIFAATNGFLDRLKVERVGEFLTELIERMHSQHGDVREKIVGGDWSEGTQKEVRDAVEAFASDFGYDLDEEGLALDDDAPLPSSDGGAAQGESAGQGETSAAREEEPAAA